MLNVNWEGFIENILRNKFSILRIFNFINITNSLSLANIFIRAVFTAFYVVGLCEFYGWVVDIFD